MTYMSLTEKFNQVVETQVRKLLSSDEILRKVALMIRATVIFDDDGIILSDYGGLEYIKEIKVEKDPRAFVVKITVIPKVFLQNAPILTCLDYFDFSITERRGPELTWVYDIIPEGIGDNQKVRFRLELLK